MVATAETLDDPDLLFFVEWRRQAEIEGASSPPSHGPQSQGPSNAWLMVGLVAAQRLCGVSPTVGTRTVFLCVDAVGVLTRIGRWAGVIQVEPHCIGSAVPKAEAAIELLQG